MVAEVAAHSVIHQTLATAPGGVVETHEERLGSEGPHPGGEKGPKESPRWESSQH